MNSAQTGELTVQADEDAGPRAKRTDALSMRERDVVKLLAEGLTDVQIADRLVLSPRTVHSHVRNSMKATGTSSRTHLAILALREGLAPLYPEEGP